MQLGFMKWLKSSLDSTNRWLDLRSAGRLLTLFALATGQIPANVNAVGAFAAETVAQAIRSAVQTATSLAGVRSLKD